MELDDLPEGLCFAGRAGELHTFRAAVAGKDAGTASFVLYSGAEVGYNPLWQDGGDILAVKEFRLARYRSNPVVLADHDARHVIGAGTAAIKPTEDGARLEGSVVWHISQNNPLAVLIAEQHAQGIRSAVSIGFVPGKGTMSRTKLDRAHPAWMDGEKFQSWRAGTFVRNPELHEWSSVAVPRDPYALQLQAWAMEAESDDDRFRRIVREVLSAEHRGWVLDAFRSDAEIRTALQAAAMVATPKPAPLASGGSFADWWSSACPTS